jgi:hypothetical protein
MVSGRDSITFCLILLGISGLTIYWRDLLKKYQTWATLKLDSTASISISLLKKKDKNTPVIKPHAVKADLYPFFTSVLNTD